MKTGLVLEGGAMRGMFTVGVLDVFIKEDIKVDGIVGVSAGAIFGVNYPSKQAGRVIAYNMEFLDDPRYMGMRSLVTTGDLINKDFAYYTVPFDYYPFDNEAYQNSGMPFYACVTNMLTGEAEYYRVEDIEKGMEILRASASMPFVTKPVMIDGVPYLDGGVADSIPYKYMFENGYDKLVVILTRDLGYVKSPMPPAPVKFFYRKYPEFAERLLHRHEEYNEAVKELAELEKDGKVFIIRPDAPLGIRRTERDKGKMQMVYNRGIAQGEKELAALKEFLK